MIVLNVHYNGMSPKITYCRPAASGQIKTMLAEFVFSEEWADYPKKTAVFISGDIKKKMPLNDESMCDVPPEVIRPGTLLIGVFANGAEEDGEEAVRYAGAYGSLHLMRGATPDDATDTEEDASAYDKLLAHLVVVEGRIEETTQKAKEAASSAKTAAQNAFNASGEATRAASMANASVETMSDWANQNIPRVLEARDEANEAASSANAAAEAANEAAAFARENGETAWDQAAYANEEATNAYSAAEGAKDATWRAREATQNATEAATLASMNSDFAREAGRYAYGIIGNLYRNAILPFTEAEISDTGESSGFVTNPDFYNTGKTYFRYKTDNGVSFKWTNPRPEKGSLKITMCAYGQYEEHFTSSMNVHYTDGTQDSFEFTHGVTVVYDTDKTKTVESMTGGPYVSDYSYQPWILLDMDVMSIIASYLIPQTDWLAEEGEAGHILNRTHYQTVLNSPGYMPYDECDVESLGVGTHLVFKPTNETHFKNTFVYESMRAADPFTYNVDYSCFYPQTGGEISFKYRAEQMVVNTLFTLIDTKNYRLVQFPSGVTAYVILDVGTLAEEYKSKFPEIGIYLDVEESVYTNRRITIQVVRVYRLNELYIPDTIARKTDIPEGGTGGASIIIREW